MAKVRVHELAKELNINSKEIITFLGEKNIEVKNHMSSLEDSSVELIKDKFAKKETKTIVKSETETKAKEETAADAPAERPKKKSSITAVFNPQNSQQGGRRQQKPAHNQTKRPQQEKPAAKPAVKTEAPAPETKPVEKTIEKTEEVKPTVQATQKVQNTEKVQAAEKVQTAEKIPAQTKPARPQNDRPQGDRNNNRFQNDRSQGDKNNNRSQGDRPFNRSQNGDRNNNRPQNGDRNNRSFNNDRGGRPFDRNDRNNQRNGQGGNRLNGNGNQSDRGGRGFNSNRPKDFKGRLDQEINKFNKEAVASVEEVRGKETRDRAENRKNNNRKQDHDKLGKKQERFINLEKHGGKKKPQQQPKQEKEEDVIKSITLPEKITIKELADKMKVQAAVIVKKLFLKGTMVTVNQEVDYDTAEEIALEFNCIAEPEEKIDVIAELLKEDEEEESTMVSRPPVVCVMGHVDHGKTSLLDAIRSTKVTDREAGGITQHIGASVVSINDQKITFLDTPGHEAFTAMRMRGANSTDIAILVVAADDGVMPQTVEAINHAKAAGIEIIVAINKIDKPSANIDRVKQELSEHQLIPEDWGGSTIFCPVSARTHEGIDNLLEMILLTAEVCELKANPNRNARGLVIEAQLDKGRGAVATILVQKGTLKVGEPIACGSCYGKVRAMIDDNGRRVKEAGPSTPVEILGLNGVPNAGEVFVSTDSDKEARSFAETFISEGKERLLEETKAKMSLDDLFSQIQSGNVKELDIIVKADVQGSVEAVKQSLEKLSNEEVVVKTIHGGVGAINESDVILASASNAIIIGFNVRPDATAKATAEREGVDVRLYKVIYNAIEDVEAAMKGMLDPIFEEKIIGHAEVRQVFKASGVGNIAGSYVLDGIFERGCKVRVRREGEQIFEGDLASLKRFKDDVKEVRTGYECGLVLDGFNDIQEFDQIEAYKMVEVPR
ncbi:MAG: translation initiation factor IF-2 [Lachnospiraceae bacterium]|nr:translation initiation factor IF-2 [Lachnospiraceae bacterium]